MDIGQVIQQIQQLQTIADNPNHPNQEMAQEILQNLLQQVQQQLEQVQQGQADPQSGGKKKKKKNCKKCGGSIFDTLGKLTNMFSFGSTPLEQLAGPELTGAFKSAGYNMLGEHIFGKKGGADRESGYPVREFALDLSKSGKKRTQETEEEARKRKRVYAQEQQRIGERQMPLFTARDMRPDITPSISGIRSPQDIAGEQAYKADDAAAALALRQQQAADNAALMARASAATIGALQRKAIRDATGSGKYKRKGGADAEDSGEETPLNPATMAIPNMNAVQLIQRVYGQGGSEFLQDLSPSMRNIVLNRINDYNANVAHLPIQSLFQLVSTQHGQAWLQSLSPAARDIVEQRVFEWELILNPPGPAVRRAGARTKGAVDKKPRKVSKWVTHVKAFAAKHNLTYPCAMSNAQCKAEYKNPPAPKPKKRLIRVPKLPEPVVEAPKPKKRLIRKPKTIE